MLTQCRLGRTCDQSQDRPTVPFATAGEGAAWHHSTAAAAAMQPLHAPPRPDNRLRRVQRPGAGEVRRVRSGFRPIAHFTSLILDGIARICLTWRHGASCMPRNAFKHLTQRCPTVSVPGQCTGKQRRGDMSPLQLFGATARPLVPSFGLSEAK